jgi:hypothetical protein
MPDAPDDRSIVAEKALSFAGNTAELVHVRPEMEREQRYRKGKDKNQ